MGLIFMIVVLFVLAQFFGGRGFFCRGRSYDEVDELRKELRELKEEIEKLKQEKTKEL
jgi:hypothetical protein